MIRIIEKAVGSFFGDEMFRFVIHFFFSLLHLFFPIILATGKLSPLSGATTVFLQFLTALLFYRKQRSIMSHTSRRRTDEQRLAVVTILYHGSPRNASLILFSLRFSYILFLYVSLKFNIRSQSCLWITRDKIAARELIRTSSDVVGQRRRGKKLINSSTYVATL